MDKHISFAELPLFLSPKDYSELTGEHVNTVYKKLVSGELPGDKQGGKWVICRDLAFPNTARGVIGNGN